MNLKHLCVDLSAHGLGHLAQTSAVLNELYCTLETSSDAINANSRVHVTVRSNHNNSNLKERINFPSVADGSKEDAQFTLLPYEQDIGMVMYDAMQVDLQKSALWYNGLYLNYEERLSEAARQLEKLQPDVLFCNVPFLSIEAAKLVGIPTIAMCSLNWADIYHGYFIQDRKHVEFSATDVYEKMLNAYSKADVFLRPTPSMTMGGLVNTQSIGPIVSRGISRDLSALVSATTGRVFEKFILIGVGGLKMTDIKKQLQRWPQIDGVSFIFPDSYLSLYDEDDDHDGVSVDVDVDDPKTGDHHIYYERPDFVPQSLFERSMKYVDLVASVDCIMTKTGYGTQTEAVLHQVPTLCIERRDWPEHDALKRWHLEHGHAIFAEWDAEELLAKKHSPVKDHQTTDCKLKLYFEKLLDGQHVRQHYPPIEPTGAAEAAGIIHDMLFPQPSLN